MNFHYHVIKQSYILENGEAHIGFGIEAVDEEGELVERVHDVSTNEAFVRELAEQFEKMNLYPVHLKEILCSAIP